MNIKQVKQHWTLETLLQQLGHVPDKRKSRGHDLWFCSPFRPNEGEPSFHINTRHNIWKDFGLDGRSGGDMIFFAQRLLQEQGSSFAISDVLKWFQELSATPMARVPSKGSEQACLPKIAPLQLLSAKPIFSTALFDYLEQRGIGRGIGQRFLKQVYFEHAPTQRKMYGLGMLNKSGSYETRNPLGFKGVIGKKDISLIKGGQGSDTIEVFEGMFDFLSRMSFDQPSSSVRKNDCLILHSTQLCSQAVATIRALGYLHVMLWLDNDHAGEKARKHFEIELEKTPSMLVEPMNHFYLDHKDLNKWHAETLGQKSNLSSFSFQ